MSKDFILRLGFGSNMKIQKDMSGIESNAVSCQEENLNLYMPFKDLVDVEEERKRLQAEKEKMEAEVKRSKGILSNPGFMSKAPESKIQEEKDKLERYEKILNDTVERLKNL